jgi:membrane fusion protein, copper/silver efflux system
MSKVNLNKEKPGLPWWLVCLAGFFMLLSSCRHSAPGTEQIAQAKSIPIPKNSMSATDQVQLNEQQIRLGNIRVDTIRTGSTDDQMVFTGILNFNQEKLSSVNTRVDGRIEKLYIKRTGEFVHKGDPLYDLYSEPLNNAKQEYANALQQQKTIGNALINYGAVVESAKGKLMLWGLTERQISGLGAAKELSTLTTFYSPETGYVTSLNVQEGGYAMEGAPVLQLADLSTLWAEAQVFTTQLSSLDMNSHVTVRIPDLDNEIIPGTIDFVNPEINPDTRINLVRVTVRNTGNQLHPGMPVYIIANNSEHHAITLPNEAVLTDSKGSVVWVQVKPGIYAVHDVQTGNSGENSTEIKKGLRPGDIVVTSGAYLINSEYIFEHGSTPMEGMDMSQN